MPFLIIGLCLVALLVILSIVFCNRLIASKNLVETSLADIDVNLQKRYDLIPKLVQIAKSYSQHEQKAFVEISKIRAEQSNMESTKIPQLLNEISVIREAYPDLKADRGFEKLMTQIREVENHLLYARQFYNGVVQEHNTLIHSFPYQLYAKPLGLLKKQYVQASSDQSQIPTSRV